MIIDPGQLDVDLSRLTEEKSMIATDTTMDNLSQHTIDDEFTRTLGAKYLVFSPLVPSK